MFLKQAQAEDQKLHATAPDLALVGPSTAAEQPRKRKGPKGPNPLSMKKKKTIDGPATAKPKPPKSSTNTDAISSAGVKRKAEVLSDDEGEGEDNIILPQSSSSKKRKRRRKAANSQNTVQAPSQV